MVRVAKIMTMLGLLVLCGSVWAVEPNLVSHWKFDEGSGTIAYDSAGDNDGTIYGAVWTSGQVGGALSFDGVDDYVLVPENANLPYGSSARTVVMWIYTKSSSWQRDENTPLHYGLMSTRRAFSLDMDTYPSMQFYTWADDLYFDAGAPWEGWVHVVIVYDGDKTIKAYTQGELRGSKTLGGTLNTGFTDIEIGTFRGLGSYFNGIIDDVRIYDRALSAEEIREIYLNLYGSELAIIHIEDAIAKKEEMLEVIDETLEKEWDAYDALEELLASGDYGNLKKGDIVKAKQKIHSAIQHQEQSIDALEKSIEKLEDALTALGWEPEPKPGETDLDGNPRVIGGRIDMGAYETNHIQAAMKLTPQMLNCNSKGKYVKAHFVLPEGFLPQDVDVNEPAMAEPMGAYSEYIKVIGNDDGPVRLEIAFDRESFCDSITETGEIEITVIGSLTTGQYFSATDTIKIKPRH